MDGVLDRLAYEPSIGARRLHMTPVVEATAETLEGFGRLVDDPDAVEIEIVRWPAQGWRSVDANSGDQGGVVEGRFDLAWRDGTLFGRNGAVGDSYLFGWSDWPDATPDAPRPRDRILMWRANYHPDGGQLVFPLSPAPFLVSLARPGDDVRPEDFISFRFDGRRGLYIPPGVWHGPFAPLGDQAAFLDRQGRVHARISVDFVREFQLYLAAPLTDQAGI